MTQLVMRRTIVKVVNADEVLLEDADENRYPNVRWWLVLACGHSIARDRLRVDVGDVVRCEPCERRPSC